MKRIIAPVLVFALVLMGAPVIADPCTLPGDMLPDCDGNVNITELIIHIGSWYKCSSCVTDLFQSIQAYYGIPFCGDTLCGTGEDCSSCPVDCVSCGNGFSTDYISWWKFDGDANDENGRNNGIFMGDAGTAYDIERHYGQDTTGQVLVLDGAGDYVLVPDDYSLEIGNGDMSFSFWIKTNDIDSNNGVICKGYGSGTEYRIQVNLYGNFYIMLNSAAYGWELWQPVAGLNDGSWKHVVLVFDRDGSNVEGTVYVDGIPLDSFDYTMGEISGSNDLYIGRISDFYISGYLDDVMIFNRSLTASEIQDLSEGQRYHCTGTEKCSDYTNSGDCAEDTCIVGMSCVWDGSHCTKSMSETWYVRPVGGDYGSEDGSSYYNAWDGLESLEWEKIDAGDTIYICGLFIGNYTTGSREFHFNIRESGLDDSSRITLRGDCPGDKGIIWDAGLINHEDWVDEGSNVWSVKAPSYGGYYEDITTSSWKVLDESADLNELQSNPGSYLKNGTRLYVHASDSGDPTGRIAANRYGYRIILDDDHYIDWRDLELYAIYRTLDVLEAPADYVTHMRWINVTNWYSGFRFRENSNHIYFIDCDIGYAGHGIATGDNHPASLEDAPHHITVRNSRIHHITGNRDSEAIGVQGTNHLMIEGNEFHDVGSAITFYTWPVQEQKNNTIRWNWVHDTHADCYPDYSCSRDRGIELNHDASHQDSTGNRVYGNIVGPGVDDKGYRYNYMDEGEFYNNICYECGISFFVNHGLHGVRVKIRNLISLNPKDYHISFASAAYQGNYSIDSDYNIFWPSGDYFKFFDSDGGSNYLNFSQWQSLSKADSTFDLHSIIADPEFVSLDPTSPADFILQATSPAIDAGMDVGLVRDFIGTVIPQDGDNNGTSEPDIGPFEYH